MRNSLKIEIDDNIMSSIVMGKSPYDVDLLGLSQSIHMRSTEKKNKISSKTKNQKMLIENDGDET